MVMGRNLKKTPIGMGTGVLLLSGFLAFGQAPGPQSQSPGGSPPMQEQRQPGSPSMQSPMDRNPADSMPAQVKVDDKTFVKEAAIGGLTEVELGKVAAQKASSDAVKQFGQKMVDDHSKANDQLKEVATKAGFEVPASPDSKHQRRIDKLSKLSGTEFDRAYIKDQLKDHKEDVNKFQQEAQGGTNPAIKNFAAQALPTLQQHLQMVQQLKDANGATSMNLSH
jgi:putative membrane protein